MTASVSPAQQTITQQQKDLASAKVNFFAHTLLPCRWRDVAFPYTDFRATMRQDLAVHKFSDLDGADIEPTGRSPLEFTAHIPFLNGIAAASSESWPSGNLFPKQFQDFWAACIDRTAAYLQHPIFGLVYCVVSHVDLDLKASTRDGVYVDVSWLETFDPAGILSPSVAGGGQLSQATQAGVDLDTLLPTLPASSFPGLPPQSTSFADFARGLQGVADSVSLLEYQTAGKIDAVVSQVQTTLAAFSRATKTPGDAANSVTCWPTRDAADRFVSAVATIKDSLLSTGQQILLYTPAEDTTIAMLAQRIPAPVSDLIGLNPSLVNEFVVPSGSVVRYYQSSVATAATPLAVVSSKASGAPNPT